MINEDWLISVTYYYYFAACEGLGAQINIVNILNTVHVFLKIL